tara:strand:- start:18982 stop:19338 length:357 start_codon:yes stop_codon:yes gene_type:complete
MHGIGPGAKDGARLAGVAGTARDAGLAGTAASGQSSCSCTDATVALSSVTLAVGSLASGVGGLGSGVAALASMLGASFGGGAGIWGCVVSSFAEQEPRTNRRAIGRLRFSIIGGVYGV